MTHPRIQLLSVAHLMDNFGKWNEPLVRESFLEEEAERILNIPINPRLKEDEVIWNLDQKGKFSVKSAYRLGRSLQQALEASSSCSSLQERQWKSFWKAKIPSKIKHYGWKLYHNILPTLSNLINKGMDINFLCLMCRSKPETAEHLFWECTFAKGIWATYFPSFNLSCLDDRNGWTTKDYCD